MRTHNLKTRNHGLASLSGLVTMIVLLALAGAARADTQPAPAKDFDYGTVNLRVGVWIEGLEEDEVLERGQAMSVGFQTNDDAYAVVYRIDTEGEVTILWPRSRMDDGFVFGGHEYMLPVAGARRLSASSRSGEGIIEVLTSRYPFDLRDLEVDFHHEYKADKHHFQVLGDPFLAMNEINYAITRLEDTEDYVVSNYLSYYVHEKVDHPRYLCNQCHFDDDLTVHPYQDECTINITYDYGWSNRWYRDYGYFPVYYNPVYVYYDPWTWRPWVNFWYDPWYRCVSYPGWNWRNPVYVWCDSPYYRGYSDYRFNGDRRKEGRGLFRPEPTAKRRTKTAEFRDVSRMVADRGPSESQRSTMVQKERTQRSDQPGGIGAAVVSRGGSDVRVGGGSATTVVGRGEAPISRSRPQINERKASSSRSGGGLQIRRPAARNGNSDGTSRVGTSPVKRGSDGRSGTIDRTNRGQGDSRIQPVEPRRQTTRIWNSTRGSRGDDRSSSSGSGGTVRSGKSGSRSDSSVGSGSKSRSGGSSRVTPTRKSSGSSVKSNRSSSGSSSSSSRSSSGSSSSVKSRSSSGSSSSSRSSGGSSSRSSGSSRSNGGSSSRTRGGR